MQLLEVNLTAIKQTAVKQLRGAIKIMVKILIMAVKIKIKIKKQMLKLRKLKNAKILAVHGINQEMFVLGY